MSEPVRCWSCGAPIESEYQRCPKCNEAAPLAQRGRPWKRRLFQCNILGGFDFSGGPGEDVELVFELDKVTVVHWKCDDEVIPAEQLSAVDIYGPGAVTTGGGFIGGGFGVVGAAVGIAIATALNALTTKTSLVTFIRLAEPQRELFVHYGILEPGALRVELSPFLSSNRLTQAPHIQRDSHA